MLALRDAGVAQMTPRLLHSFLFDTTLVASALCFAVQCDRRRKSLEGQKVVHPRSFAQATESATPPCSDILLFDRPGKSQEGDRRFRGRADLVGGGLVLVREAERRIGLSETLAGCNREWRDPERVVHVLPGMLRFRMFATPAGTRIDDCDAYAALFKLASAGRQTAATRVPSQPSVRERAVPPSNGEHSG